MHRKRSSKKREERRIRGIILRGSFTDKCAGEVVSRMTRLDVLRQMSGSEPIEVGLVPDVEKGEVLADSRGGGSFQRENEGS